jgi:hypothetical protein
MKHGYDSISLGIEGWGAVLRRKAVQKVGGCDDETIENKQWVDDD